MTFKKVIEISLLMEIDSFFLNDTVFEVKIV